MKTWAIPTLTTKFAARVFIVCVQRQGAKLQSSIFIRELSQINTLQAFMPTAVHTRGACALWSPLPDHRYRYFENTEFHVFCWMRCEREQQDIRPSLRFIPATCMKTSLPHFFGHIVAHHELIRHHSAISQILSWSITACEICRKNQRSSTTHILLHIRQQAQKMLVFGEASLKHVYNTHSYLMENETHSQVPISHDEHVVIPKLICPVCCCYTSLRKLLNAESELRCSIDEANLNKPTHSSTWRSKCWCRQNVLSGPHQDKYKIRLWLPLTRTLETLESLHTVPIWLVQLISALSSFPATHTFCKPFNVLLA